MPGRAERRDLMPEGARAPVPVYEDGLAGLIGGEMDDCDDDLNVLVLVI